MSRIISTMQLDFKIHIRNKLYLITLAIAVLMGLGLGYIVTTQYEMMGALPTFYLLTIGGTTIFFVGGIVIFEKDENTLDAQSVSPLRTWEYLTSKVITLTILATIEAAIVFIIAYYFTWNLNNVNVLLLTSGVALMGAFLVLVGFVMIVRYQNVTDFLFPAFGITILLQLPLLHVGGMLESDLWLLFPTMPMLQLIVASFEVPILPPVETWKIIYGFAYSGVMIAVMFWWALRAHYRFNILKEG